MADLFSGYPKHWMFDAYVKQSPRLGKWTGEYHQRPVVASVEENTIRDDDLQGFVKRQGHAMGLPTVAWNKVTGTLMAKRYMNVSVEHHEFEIKELGDAGVRCTERFDISHFVHFSAPSDVMRATQSPQIATVTLVSEFSKPSDLAHGVEPHLVSFDITVHDEAVSDKLFGEEGHIKQLQEGMEQQARTALEQMSTAWNHDVIREASSKQAGQPVSQAPEQAPSQYSSH